MRKKSLTKEQKADKDFFEAKTFRGRISAARKHKSKSVTIIRAGADVVKISFKDRPLSYFEMVCSATPGDRVLFDVTETEQDLLATNYKKLGFVGWTMTRHIDPDHHDGGHRRIALFRAGYKKDPDPIMNCFTLQEILASLRRHMERDELMVNKQDATRPKGPKHKDEKKATRIDEFNKLAKSKRCAKWSQSAIAKEAAKNLKNRFRGVRGYGWRQIYADVAHS